MEDTNLEQALENADAVARSVYREEAKVIEELRKWWWLASGKKEGKNCMTHVETVHHEKINTSHAVRPVICVKLS